MRLKEKWERHSFVHLYWIIGVLVFTVICLLSSDLGTNNNVKDIINFAVSLTSLVLAIFAIGQAFVSGSALPEAVSSVREAINEIKEPAKQISNSAELINAYSKSIDERALGIQENVSLLISQNKTSEVNNIKLEVAEDVGKVIVSPDVMQRSSHIFRLGLYVAFRSYKTKKSYTFRRMAETPEKSLNIAGVISALSSLNIIDTDSASGKGVWVSDLGAISWIEDNLEDVLEYIRKFEINKKRTSLSHIDKYFDDDGTSELDDPGE